MPELSVYREVLSIEQPLLDGFAQSVTHAGIGEVAWRDAASLQYPILGPNEVQAVCRHDFGRELTSDECETLVERIEDQMPYEPTDEIDIPLGSLELRLLGRDRWLLGVEGYAPFVKEREIAIRTVEDWLGLPVRSTHWNPKDSLGPIIARRKDRDTMARVRGIVANGMPKNVTVSCVWIERSGD